MKNSFILVSLTLLLISISLYSSELAPFSDFNKSKMMLEKDIFKKNSIKEKHTYRSDFSSGKEAKKWLVSKEYYDEYGNMIKFESYNDYNEVIVNSNFKYNNDNMLIEVEEKDSFRTIIMKQELSYDSAGKLVKIISSGFGGDTLQTTNFDYVQQKQVSIETTKDSSNKVQDYYVHLYDKAFNRIIKSSNFNNSNEMNGITAYFYDNNGINSREVYNKDINEPYRIKYQNVYDEKGRLTEVKNLKYPDVLIVTVFNEYNQYNLISKTTMIQPTGEVIATILFDYITN